MSGRPGGKNSSAQPGLRDFITAMRPGPGKAALCPQSRRPPTAPDHGQPGKSGGAAHVLYVSAQAPVRSETFRYSSASHGALGGICIRLHRRNGLPGAEKAGGRADGPDLQPVPAGRGGAYSGLPAAHRSGRFRPASPAGSQLSAPGAGDEKGPGKFEFFGFSGNSGRKRGGYALRPADG